MDKYSHYYLNDFNDRYDAFSEVDTDGEWYRVSDVEDMTTRLLADKNARIAELERELKVARDEITDLRAFIGVVRNHVYYAAKAYGLTS